MPLDFNSSFDKVYSQPKFSLPYFRLRKIRPYTGIQEKEEDTRPERPYAGAINLPLSQQNTAFWNPKNSQDLLPPASNTPYTVEMDPNQMLPPITQENPPLDKKPPTPKQGINYFALSQAAFTGLDLLGQKSGNNYQNAIRRYNNERTSNDFGRGTYSTQQDFYGKFEKGGGLKGIKELYEVMSSDPEYYSDELNLFRNDYEKQIENESFARLNSSVLEYVDDQIAKIDNQFKKQVKSQEEIEGLTNPYDNWSNPYLGDDDDDDTPTYSSPLNIPNVNVGFKPKVQKIPNDFARFRVIQDAAERHGVPPEILGGVYAAETSYGRNKNVSSAGAEGPFQFMPGTARQYGINPYNFEQAADAAAKFLASNYKKTGNWEDAVAGYNAGPGNMNRWRNIKETRGYVPTVFANASNLKNNNIFSK